MEKNFDKYFTPYEATRTLPLVKQIVRDILNYSIELRTIAESLTGKPEENPEVSDLLSKVNACIKELEEIGCFYKDWSFSVGLVDFPAIIDGEKVFLCWRSDEEDVSYYHNVHEGFAGRKLIPGEYFVESI